MLIGKVKFIFFKEKYFINDTVLINLKLKPTDGAQTTTTTIYMQAIHASVMHQTRADFRNPFVSTQTNSAHPPFVQDYCDGRTYNT